MTLLLAQVVMNS